MLEQWIPRSTKKLIIYPEPVSMRWGSDRLRLACERDLGVPLDLSTAVIFHNRAKDTLILFTLDEDGDRSVTKKLEKGAFLLPVPREGQKFVTLAASMVSSLFRT